MRGRINSWRYTEDAPFETKIRYLILSDQWRRTDTFILAPFAWSTQRGLYQNPTDQELLYAWTQYAGLDIEGILLMIFIPRGYDMRNRSPIL